MNVIYIGSFYPENRINEIRLNSKNGLDNASNVFQKALLQGLDSYFDDLKVITVPTIKSFPFNYKKIRIKSSIFSHKKKSIDFCVGYFNMPIIKFFSKYYNLYIKIKELLKSTDENIIIIYSIHSPFLRAVYEILKINKHVKTCLIVPDLPQFMSESKNSIYLLLKRIDLFFINKYLKKIDSFTVLTEYMLEKLPIKQNLWTLIEGIYAGANIKCQEKAENIIITYTGNLDFRFGIENLLTAFSTINNSNFRLWICGAGNTKNKIIEMVNDDPRIVFWGELTFEEVQELQTKSTLLINPRTSDGEYTKYSFPSKTMEYLASKTPCIMHRLPGIPNEYYNYIYVAEKEDANGLKDMILQISMKDKDELKQFGERAAEFIYKNKNPFIQVEKIYNMIQKL